MIGNCIESRIIRLTIYRGAIAGRGMSWRHAAPLHIETLFRVRAAPAPEGACVGKNNLQKKDATRIIQKTHLLDLSEDRNTGFSCEELVIISTRGRSEV